MNRVSAGYGISVVFHLLFIIVLSLLTIRHDQRGEQFAIQASISENEAFTLQELADLNLDLPEAVPFVNPQTVASLPTTFNPALFGVSADQSPGESLGYAMPGGGRAVTQGSFTAWTVPEDPKPYENYLVVIQVSLPEGTTRYRKEDLSGFLSGDDGYETPIGEYRGRRFPKQYYGHFDLEARQLVIRIPGAAAKVKDSISIESRVLSERQELEIIF